MALSDVIERIAKVSNRTRAIVVIAICAIIGGAFYFMVYSDQIEESARLDRKVTELQGEKATYEDRKQKYQAFRAEVNKLLEEQKELLKVLPDESNISTFLESIHAQAELSGVRILTYDQRPEVRRDFYAEIPVSLTVSGSYHQLAKFFYYLERDVKRIVKIQGLGLTSPAVTPNGVVLKAAFTASTYRFVGKKPG